MINWLLRNSLWLMSLGVMICSSGVDGAYMAKLMPPVLGYALNTVSDVSSELLMFWYGRLRQFPRNTKRHRMARWLLVAELFLTEFAWLFGWRQLLPIVAALEGERVAQWLAPVLAAFTPTLLVAAGYAQSLLAGRIEDERGAGDTKDTKTAAKAAVSFSGNGAEKPYRICIPCGFTAQSPQAWAGHCKGARHKRNTAELAPVISGNGGNR